MFALKPDYELTKKRMDAFWARDVIDRPLVQFVLYKPIEARLDLPPSNHLSVRTEWEDAQYQAERALVNLSNQLFLGDSLPVAWPNLGPDVFASFYGCPMHYDNHGFSWSTPCLNDLSESDSLKFDWESDQLVKLTKMTNALLEIGDGKFITGMSGWHSSGDCLAALLGATRLAADLIRNPIKVKGLIERINYDYQKLYMYFYERLKAMGQPITTWVQLTGEGKYYTVSNDFSIMISADMYREFFLNTVVEECRFLDHSLYHLDGQGALRHLELLLEIPELDGIQFIPTPGSAEFLRWKPVYQRIQDAGKSLQITCILSEIEDIIENVRPEGLCLYVQDVTSLQEAQRLIKRLEKWNY